MCYALAFRIQSLGIRSFLRTNTSISIFNIRDGRSLPSPIRSRFRKHYFRWGFELRQLSVRGSKYALPHIRKYLQLFSASDPKGSCDRPSQGRNFFIWRLHTTPRLCASSTSCFDRTQPEFNVSAAFPSKPNFSTSSFIWISCRTVGSPNTCQNVWVYNILLAGMTWVSLPKSNRTTIRVYCPPKPYFDKKLSTPQV